MSWTQVSYTYDGSFSGFLTCVYESYRHKEAPAAFSTPEDPQISLYPERPVKSDPAKARQVYLSLARKISPSARELVTLGFLTCAEERELLLWNYIWYGYARGRAAGYDLSDPRVAALEKAVRHLRNEVHLFKGFLRFSDLDGVLASPFCAPISAPGIRTRISSSTTAPTGRPSFTRRAAGPSCPWSSSPWGRPKRKSGATGPSGGGSIRRSPLRDGKIPAAA